jgi:membrane protein
MMPDKSPDPDLKPKIPILTPAWDFLAVIYYNWRKDNAMTLGAALAFYTTFSMAPLLIIIIAIFGFILGETTIQAEILRRVRELIGEQGASSVKMMIGAAYRPGTSLVATLIGISVTVVGSTSAFVMLKQALNTMWGARPAPDPPLWFMLKERLVSFFMILVIGLLLVLSLLLSVVLSFLTRFFHTLLPIPPVFMELTDLSLSILLITLLFAVIYKVLPDVEIAWTDVWIGSFITALLFTLGKLLFSLYLSHSSITSAYGAASSLAVILMWVYYSAQVFFLGAEITQVYANRYGSHVKPRERTRNGR